VSSTQRHDVATPVGIARLHVYQSVAPRAVFFLGHGAGRGVDTADLETLAGALPGLGATVILVDQPWVVNGGRIAPAPATLDRAWCAAVGQAYAVMPELSLLPLVLGGRSAGARVAARTAAGLGAVALLLLAVPLTPPSARQDADRARVAREIRVAELGLALSIGIPTVAVQGDRDQFGDGPALRAAVDSQLSSWAAARLEVLAVPGADHSLCVRVQDRNPADALVAAAGLTLAHVLR